nr:hypothetical protein GCM10023233_35160 [Brevibacterium otitidis]
MNSVAGVGELRCQLGHALGQPERGMEEHKISHGLILAHAPGGAQTVWVRISSGDHRLGDGGQDGSLWPWHYDDAYPAGPIWARCCSSTFSAIAARPG